jgi:hypothetical protein
MSRWAIRRKRSSRCSSTRGATATRDTTKTRSSISGRCCRSSAVSGPRYRPAGSPADPHVREGRARAQRDRPGRRPRRAAARSRARTGARELRRCDRDREAPRRVAPARLGAPEPAGLPLADRRARRRPGLDAEEPQPLHRVVAEAPRTPSEDSVVVRHREDLEVIGGAAGGLAEVECVGELPTDSCSWARACRSSTSSRRPGGLRSLRRTRRPAWYRPVAVSVRRPPSRHRGVVLGEPSRSGRGRFARRRSVDSGADQGCGD